MYKLMTIISTWHAHYCFSPASSFSGPLSPTKSLCTSSMHQYVTGLHDDRMPAMVQYSCDIYNTPINVKVSVITLSNSPPVLSY